MASQWKSAGDLEKDIWLFSEISENDDTHEPAPASILEYNARIGANHNVSIFDMHVPSEDVTYVSCGRGRGGVSKIFKPGNPVQVDREDEQAIYRYIREVSGLGYSNELIEQAFKKPTPLPVEEEFCDAKEKEDEGYFRFICKSPDMSSSLSVSDTTPKSSSSVRSSSSLSSVAPSPVEEKIVDDHPPPLSVILSRGRGRKKVTQKVSEVDNEDGTRKKDYSLNPAAEEFQYLGNSSLVSPVSTNSLAKRSNVQIKSEREISSEREPESFFDTSSSPEVLSWRRRDKNVYSNGNGEELSWRRREVDNVEVSPKRNVKSWRDFTRNERNYDFYMEGARNRDFKDTSFSEAALPWRGNDKSFDIKSDDDFPAL